MTKDEALKLALEALEMVVVDVKTTPTAYEAHRQAITAIKQALAAPVQETAMIYKTFEQWKSGNVLEHGVPRTEYYSKDQLDLVEMGWNYGYDAGRAVEQALDKKAENARELGLDYEPAPVQEPDVVMHSASHTWTIYRPPPKGSGDVNLFYAPVAQRKWVGLTDKDRQEAFESMPDMLDGFLKKWGWLHFSKAIEAKLKEKNTCLETSDEDPAH